MEGASRSPSRTGSNQRERGRDLRVLRRLAAYLAPHRWKAAGALVALAFAAAAVLSLGVGLRHLVDSGFAEGRPEALDHALQAVLIVIAVLAAATFARSYLVTWLGERVVADLRRDVYAHVVRLSPGFFEVTRTGEVLSRLTTDTSVIQTVIGASVTQALRNLILLFGGLALLLVTNPRLTGLTLVVVPLVVVPLVVIGRKVRALSRRAQDATADVSSAAEETLNAVRTVQSFAQEERESRRFAAAAEGAFRAAAAHARARAALGAIVIALIFAAIVASAVGGLSEIFGDLQRAAGATERLFELLATEPAIKAPERPRSLPARPRGAVRLEGVGFVYPANPERPTLEGVDLDVRPGETVALVGPSGAGKSTVFQLLMRFYDPTRGRILLDGVPITELDPRLLRAHTGLVPQEPAIFSADAWANIRYGRPDASDAEVLAAAEAAQAREFLEALPQGFATFLGEKGVRLSGGQRQRIAIARAVLRDPALLLLDEATSALDAENERLVQAALERLMRGRTCLVIAHRLATVLKADRIVVLDGGRVVDQGRHEDLLRRGGLYSRLAELQFNLDRAAA
jgi:ATP-binding cassette, subfamily B, bacterial